MRVILGVLFGAAFGFGWYRVVGCSTGTCPITANPWISTAYGAFMGAMIASN